MKADLDRITWFRDFCLRTRGVTEGGRTQGVQAIPDLVTRGELGIASFGGGDAPWAQELMTAWNQALEWRRNEATAVARELLSYAQALEKAAREYIETDQDAATDINQYYHG